MTSQELITAFETMYREKWAYEWGAAKKGLVDCAGAFVYSMGKKNLKIYHGSNRMARVEVEELLPREEWKPGMAAFKKRMPGEALYALPQKYKPGGENYNGDIADYYHVGLVDQNGMVLNAQSKATGFVRSKMDGSWCCVGRLKKIVYKTEGEIMQATVQSGNGGPVRLRETPSTEKPYIDKVLNGTVVQVLGKMTMDGVSWVKVQIGEKIGYMMGKYLEGQTEEKTQAPAQDDKLDQILEEVLAIKAMLEETKN